MMLFCCNAAGPLGSVNTLGGSLTELRAVSGGGNETLQLDYLSGNRNGVPQLPGNLYALMRGQRVLDPLEVAENEANDIVPSRDIVTQVYRFAVIEDSVGTINIQIIDKRGADATQQVAGPLVQYDQYRSSFATDGALLFNTNPKDQTSNDFVRVTSISTTTTQDSVSNDNSITAALNVDLDKNYNVGTIVRDSASGAWYVPGDWGVRVNE
ncbi:MAG: hypothetical protein IPP67_03675 [Rhodospirillaceae bacterium]|nr:hypothetical protein [Rhodospirillaceae bacterium]